MFSLFSFGFFPSTSSTTVEVHLSSLTVIFFQLHSREATQETPAQLPNFTTSGIANRQATFSFCLFNDPSVPQWQRLRTKRGKWQVRPQFKAVHAFTSDSPHLTGLLHIINSANHSTPVFVRLCIMFQKKLYSASPSIYKTNSNCR